MAWRSRFLLADDRSLERDCAGMPINLDALTLLPPVTAIRWENV
jgi:hypothetical protein